VSEDLSITHDASKLGIDQRQSGDVTVLALRGELLLDDGDLVFRARVQDLVSKGCRKFVLDFGGVTHIDSSGVGMIIAKLQTIRKLGGDIRLAAMPQRYQRLLTTMRVLQLFQVFDDEAAAVRSYSVPVIERLGA